MRQIDVETGQSGRAPADQDGSLAGAAGSEGCPTGAHRN